MPQPPSATSTKTTASWSHTPPSDASIERIRRAASTMATHAKARVESQHQWFASLSAEDRSWIGVIAQGGITTFIDWLAHPAIEASGAIDVFAGAPAELTRRISLEHTLDLLRTVIAVVEDEAPSQALAAEQALVREAVLHYSREVAFAAAHIYARAAESRGAWDARLESLIVDALVRGETDDAIGARVNAVGWADVRGVVVLVGSSPVGGESSIIDPIRRAAAKARLELLVSVEGRRLIAVLGGVGDDPLPAAAALAEHFGPGPLIAGPRVPHLYAAGRSARDAVRGFDAAPAARDLPRPARSDDLLAERAVAGDPMARRALIRKVTPIIEGNAHLGETARIYVQQQSLEGAARALFVHPNTVRYRLGKIADMTGLDLTNGRDAFTIQLALMLTDLEPAVVNRNRRRSQSL